jgi:2-keto-3-deoxy-L-fuconate dehydrogenase
VVWATDKDEKLLSELSSERPGLRTRLLDVLAPQRVTDFAAEVGAVDVLFNCAGYLHHGTILDCARRVGGDAACAVAF